MRSWIPVANAASTLVMTGIIWLIQLIHYPAFSFIGESSFVSFATFPQQRISMIVIPLMLVEAISTALLLHRPHPAFAGRVAKVAALCLFIAWLSTVFLQAPIHQHMLKGRDGELLIDLIAGNWWRTVAWSARAFLVCFGLQRFMQSVSDEACD
jgi:hypothetical protein